MSTVSSHSEIKAIDIISVCYSQAYLAPPFAVSLTSIIHSHLIPIFL